MDCGADISNRHHGTKRCRDCAAEMNRLYKKRSAKTKKHKEVEICGQAQSHCRGCWYVHRMGYCDYFSMTGHTRTSLHKDDLEHLNDPCKEYKPKGKKNIVERRA